MKRVMWWVSIYATLLVAQAATAGALRNNVVVIQPPIFPLVQQVMKGAANPTLLLKGGQDSHDFQLSPSQAKVLSDADIIITVDRGLSAVLAKPIRERVAKGAVVIALTELSGADPLPYRKQNRFTETASAHASHEDGHEDTHADAHAHSGVIDPHIWLDPVRMANLMPALARALGNAMPAYEATFAHNAELLADHLRDDVTFAIQTMLHAKPDSRDKDILAYITYHDAYHYFEQRFKLSPHGFITQMPEEYIGTAAMKKLMESARIKQVRCIIAESPNSLAKRFAIYTNAKIIQHSPEQLYTAKDAPAAIWIKNDYDRLLARTAKVFAECLSGSVEH